MSPVCDYSIYSRNKPQYLQRKNLFSPYMQSISANSSLPVAGDIERVFNATFGTSLGTVLLGGAPEPFYCPADANDARHRIFYREDFVSSSLHEIAHWLVAGPERRLLPDWGYWYAPDGRNAQQQRVFERVEVKPQALEWLLHLACRLPFRVSLDNLGADAGDGRDFKDNVYQQACLYQRDGVNARAQQLYAAFALAFGGPEELATVTLSRLALD